MSCFFLYHVKCIIDTRSIKKIYCFFKHNACLCAHLRFVLISFTKSRVPDTLGHSDTLTFISRVQITFIGSILRQTVRSIFYALGFLEFLEKMQLDNARTCKYLLCIVLNQLQLEKSNLPSQISRLTCANIKTLLRLC